MKRHKVITRFKNLEFLEELEKRGLIAEEYNYYNRRRGTPGTVFEVSENGVKFISVASLFIKFIYGYSGGRYVRRSYVMMYRLTEKGKTFLQELVLESNL